MQPLTKPLVGREPELAALRAVLGEVRTGQPRLILLEGSAGIGKTALLDCFVREELDVRVLRATGEQWEAFVSFGVVDQLMRAAGVRETNVLLDRQRALTVEEPANVGALLLELWGTLDARGPVISIIDDAQWSDIDSLRALLFAMRRLVGERVLVLLAARGEDVVRLPEGLRRMADGPTGRILRVGPLKADGVRTLAASLDAGNLSARVAERLQAHTGGNPLYLRSLFDEVPPATWRSWEPALPAPRAFAAQVHRRLRGSSDESRRLVEAASALGTRADLQTAAALAEISDPLPALDAATDSGLLLIRDQQGIVQVAFPHPLVHAAVYEQLPAARRAELHRAAAAVLEGENIGEALHHRVLAAVAPDPELVAELGAFARAETARGAWASAASALVTASRLCSSRAERERLLLRAADALVSAGDVLRAQSFTDEILSLPPSAMRDSALGYLAVLRGHAEEAEQRLHSAWQNADSGEDVRLKATIAQRLAVHAVARLRAQEMTDWARRAIELAPLDDPARVDASAILGVGLAWLGRTSEGLAVHESARDRSPEGRHATSSGGLALTMANGWLRLATDELSAARAQLSDAASSAFRAGSVRVAVYAFSWLARTNFCRGAWDEAVIDAERALALLLDTGHTWLRPLALWTATMVPAARGDWSAAEKHARSASAMGEEYEMMIVAGGLARAQLATARSDHQAVLRALEPLLVLADTSAINEPGFWPWHDLYGDALVSAHRVAEADDFLGPHEERARQRDQRSAVARLARVRGRIYAASGKVDDAEAAFQHGLQQLQGLSMPFERALLELAYGQVLRRDGKRRAAALQLQACNDTFVILGAQPYLERSERELVACGLTPSGRRDFDAQRLTPQELSVARLIAQGLSNRDIASELMLSVKTVQSHLTRAYSKLGITSRAQLAATFRSDAPSDMRPD